MVLGSDGTIYVVFDFMQVFPPAPPQPAATPLPAPARTVVMDHIVSRHDGPSTTQPAPPPTTEPVVAPPPAPRPPPAAATQVPPPPAALNALIGQLRATDGPLRHRGGRPGSAKIVRTAGTWTQRSAPAPRRSPAASDTAAASRLWLPASYCEGPNKARSRMC